MCEAKHSQQLEGGTVLMGGSQSSDVIFIIPECKVKCYLGLWCQVIDFPDKFSQLGVNLVGFICLAKLPRVTTICCSNPGFLN